MIIFVVVGMPASGKNIAREYAEKHAIPYFATGDIVRGEMNRRGLSPDPENTAVISSELRSPDGMGVTRIALKNAVESSSRIVFMEGMRSWAEVELIREQVKCIIISFVAPRALRLQRIIARGRADDSAAAFDERDRREISYGCSIPIALADEYILNTGSVDKALSDLDSIVQSYR